MTRRTRHGAAMGAMAALLAGAGAAQAQIASGGGPVDVTANQLELIDAQHMAIYRGDVEAVQNGARLVSDVLNVYFSGKPAPGAGPAAPAKPAAGAPSVGVGADWGQVQRLVADGHVFYVSENQTVRGEHAVYDLEPDTITMTGDVVIVQGQNVVKGDKLVIQVKTGHTDIISNSTGRNKPERVRGVFYNDNTQQAAGAAAAPAKAPAPAKTPAKP